MSGTTMSHALDDFCKRMYTANKAFINARIDEIQAMNLASEKAKLDVIARFWSHSQTWPGYPSGETMDHFPLYQAVSCLEEVRDLPHPAMDGVWRNSTQMVLQDDRDRTMWFEEAEKVANAQAGNTDPEDLSCWITLPDEVNDFLQEVDGVVDIDLRYDGMAEFALPVRLAAEKYRLSDYETRRKHLRYVLQSLQVDLEDTRRWPGIGDEYEVLAGFLTGEGGRVDYYTWRSYYLYCRRLEEGSNEENKLFAWRIFFYALDDDDEPARVFDTIVGFLDWYARWPERMDEARMKDLMYGETIFENDDDIENLEDLLQPS